MFNQGFYTPYGMSMPQMMPYSALTRGTMGLGGRVLGNQGMGLMGKIGHGTGLLKGVNWGGLLNNASRALGVVNQAIPLVKQAGPMFNNMKSMLRLASAFKDETDSKKVDNSNSNSNSNTMNNKQVNDNTFINNTTSSNSQNPNFFI